MEKFTVLEAIAAPIMRINIDTDVIIPSREMKRVSKEGLSEGMFANWRYTEPGGREENPDFVLNQEPYRQAKILLSGDNFGCGSSREHAPWALLDQGITCVIAPSFADIFYNNCANNGILAIALPQEVCDGLAVQAGGGNSVVEIDLDAQIVIGPDGEAHMFEFDEGRKEKLLKGLDNIGLSLQAEGSISAFEAERKLSMPWLEGRQ